MGGRCLESCRICCKHDTLFFKFLHLQRLLLKDQNLHAEQVKAQEGPTLKGQALDSRMPFYLQNQNKDSNAKPDKSLIFKEFRRFLRA